MDTAQESSEYWTRQKVTFNTAYGNERMSAYVYLPRNASIQMKRSFSSRGPTPYMCDRARTWTYSVSASS